MSSPAPAPTTEDAPRSPGTAIDLGDDAVAPFAPDAVGAVRLRGVTKRYGTTVAVDALDLDVRAGEFLSLLGPSGCGKTTTLRMLAGFEQPDGGDILISGAPVAGSPPHKRAVNTVFQAYALFPHMSVAENVAYGLRQRKVAKATMRQQVVDALGMVQMTALANRSPRQLSGGQQQRVALARALVNRPSVLLLDEPMSALDRKLREEMQIELKLLQSRLGTTFVFVTHDQEEALSMSDRVAVMNDGRLEQIGASDAVYDQPATAFVAGFIGKQNFLTGTVERAPDAPGTRGLVVRGSALADGTRLVVTRALAAAAGGGPARPFEPGDQVVCAVRPESVVVVPAEAAPSTAGSAPAPDDNSLHGTLAGVSQLGHTVQLVVMTSTGQEVLARVPRSAGFPAVLGGAVVCRWQADAVHVFDAAHSRG